MTQKAPGKAHREGISLIDLFRQFPDDKTAESWFEEQRWGQAGIPSHWELYTKVTSGPAKPLTYLDLGGFPSAAATAAGLRAFR